MLDPKEEQQFAELKKLARKLHVPIPEVFIELEVRDKSGNVIQRHRQRSHSWVRNAYNLMFSELAGKDAADDAFGAGKLNIKDTGDTLKYGAKPIAQKYDVSADVSPNSYMAAAGATASGILVGSGTNAESFEDYVLQTPIAEGTGAGELNHVASEPHSVTYADTTLTNTLVRYFNNNTVGETSVDVNEVALVGVIYANGAFCYSLISRDKLALTVTVPSTGQLKVTYTISLTYAA